jgi:hypothetical protein
MSRSRVSLTTVCRYNPNEDLPTTITLTGKDTPVEETHKDHLWLTAIFTRLEPFPVYFAISKGILKISAQVCGLSRNSPMPRRVHTCIRQEQSVQLRQLACNKQEERLDMLTWKTIAKNRSSTCIVVASTSSQIHPKAEDGTTKPDKATIVRDSLHKNVKVQLEIVSPG